VANKVGIEKKQMRKCEAYHRIFSSPDGKIVLHDMMKTHYVLSTTHVNNDPISTAHNEGERNAVIRILAVLKVTPAKMQRMMEEATDENI
jgi:hypothetical protein